MRRCLAAGVGEGGADGGEGGAGGGGLGSARWGKVERTVAKTQAAGSGVGAGLSVDGEGRGAGCGGLAGHHLAVVILEVDEVTFH